MIETRYLALLISVDCENISLHVRSWLTRGDRQHENTTRESSLL
jgi:hypothetical protein